MKNIVPKVSITDSKIGRLDLIFEFLETSFAILEMDIGTFKPRFSLLITNIGTFWNGFCTFRDYIGTLIIYVFGLLDSSICT